MASVKNPQGVQPFWGCTGLMVIVLLSSVALGLEAFGGAFFATLRHLQQREDRDTRLLYEQKQVVEGVVTQVRKEGESGRSIRYDVIYTFSLPSGQRFTGSSVKEQNQFVPGQKLTVEYAMQDPMLNCLPGDTGSSKRLHLGMYFFVIGWLLFLPLMSLFSGLRNTPYSLLNRLVFVAFLGLAGLAGYSFGGKMIGGWSAGKAYTVQLGDATVLSGTRITCSDRGTSLAVGEEGLVVNGMRHPLPPEHAHIWLKDGVLLVNNRPWPPQRPRK